MFFFMWLYLWADKGNNVWKESTPENEMKDIETIIAIFSEKQNILIHYIKQNSYLCHGPSLLLQNVETYGTIAASCVPWRAVSISASKGVSGRRKNSNFACLRVCRFVGNTSSQIIKVPLLTARYDAEFLWSIFPTIFTRNAHKPFNFFS